MDADYEKRFSGVGRLVGLAGLERLQRARVCVIGIGGVGAWTVEALARSGVGSLTLMDLDDICLTNTNRQIHAVEGNYGLPKTEVMAARVRAIQPGCTVEVFSRFFTAATASQVWDGGFDCVVDAIDSLSNKCLLLAGCRERGIPVVATAGAGGRRDPTAVRVVDLTEVFNDGLAASVRKKLRREYGFPGEKQGAFGVPCVFSTERAVFPKEDGTVCEVRESGADYRLNCASGFGTAAYVTGAFGFAAASAAVGLIAG